jgi:hypothetical protein
VEKRNTYSWAFAFLIALLQASFIITRFSGWGYDDAFITFRYAENIYQGVGFVYNPGEKVLSTTTPFFTLLLVLLRYLSPNLPQLAVLVGTISLPLGGLFLWDLAYQWKRPITAWFSLLIYPIFPLLLNTLGSEMPLFLALCLAAVAFYSRSRFTIAAVCLAFATLTRPEGGLVVILLIMHYALMHRKPPPWRAILTFVFLCAPWILFSTLYFGSPIPATLAAKQAQGAMSISQRFAPGFLTILDWGYLTRWQYWVLTFLVFFAFLSWKIHNKIWCLIALWGVFHFLTYSLLGVSRYFWYYAPLVPSFIITAGHGAQIIFDWLKLRLQRQRSLITGLSGIVLFSLMLSVSLHSVNLSKHPDNRIEIYKAVGEWIKTNTKDDAIVGTLEVGMIGYYSERMMIDFSGLIQPSIAQVIKQSSTYEDAARWGIQHYEPEYLIISENDFPSLMNAMIKPYCEQQFIFRGTTFNYTSDLSLYHCDWERTNSDVNHLYSRICSEMLSSNQAENIVMIR